MKQEDDHLLSFATLGFFAFSLVHNLANQFTQLLYYVEEAQEYLPQHTQDRLKSTTNYLATVVRDSQALLVKDSACNLWFDLENCVCEALELSEYEIRNRRAEVRTQLKTAYVMGNKVILLQVLLNILKNSLLAIKGSKRKMISIRIRRIQEQWIIEIQDSGPGLEDLPQLLSSQSPHGHGLGVAYCRHSMEQNFGGSFDLINIRSGKGCLCTLRFPDQTLPKNIRHKKQSPVE